MSKRHYLGAALAALMTAAASASANVYITQFCSDVGNGTHLEYVQVTNTGDTPVDMTGWSQDDSHATPNQPGHSLSGLGILAPGASGLITQAIPSDLRSFWGSQMPAGVPIVGPYSIDDLSTTADSVTLFNASGTLVDRLDYSTTNGGTGDSVARNAPLDVLGKNDNSLWVDSYIGDAFGSFHAFHDVQIIGDPGKYLVLPEPASMELMGLSSILLLRQRRRSG
jgi:hypothetical protein